MKWCVKKYVKKKNNKEEPKKISEELFPLTKLLISSSKPWASPNSLILNASGVQRSLEVWEAIKHILILPLILYYIVVNTWGVRINIFIIVFSI